MRKVILVLIVLAAIAAIVLPFGRRSLFGHKLELRAYFDDAGGLHSGAPVRVAGVDVGIVESVRVRPELREHPAEVVMALNTPYELKIPSDSVVSLASAGVLGEVLVNIEVRTASGPPAQNGAVLKAVRAPEMPTGFLQQLADALQKRCGDSTTNQDPRAGAKLPPERKQ